MGSIMDNKTRANIAEALLTKLGWESLEKKLPAAGVMVSWYDAQF